MQKHILSGNVYYVSHHNNNGKTPFTAFGLIEDYEDPEGNEHVRKYHIKAFRDLSVVLEKGDLPIKKGQLARAVSYSAGVDTYKGTSKIVYTAYDVHILTGGTGPHHEGGSLVSVLGTDSEEPEVPYINS